MCVFLGTNWIDKPAIGKTVVPDNEYVILIYYVIVWLTTSCFSDWSKGLGVRKSIPSVKIEWWGADVICPERGAQNVCIWPGWCHCHPKTPSLHASFKSRLILLFCYWLTQVVLEKWPLNWCSSSSSSSSSSSNFQTKVSSEIPSKQVFMACNKLAR